MSRVVSALQQSAVRCGSAELLLDEMNIAEQPLGVE